MKQSYLMLLWHMHQPFYKDLVENAYTMPWVRLHALKDYYGMVAILREFPAFHATFNLVPSLVLQLQEYARDEAREQAYGLAFKLAVDLSPEEREKLVQYSFQVNVANLVNRLPRFRELYDWTQSNGAKNVARLLGTHDLIDLQVLSQLAWFDEIYLASDKTIHALVEKGRGYTEEDKVLVRKKEIEIFNVTLEEYRNACWRGQIEISTSPFYHPILPLLCDTTVAQESHPGVILPHSFRHPEDAAAQLREAVRFHEEIFGRRPLGLWPSEGSVSDEVLRLAAREGFRWAATDEGVLGRTLKVEFRHRPDGSTEQCAELYRPYRFLGGEQPISLFFRDHQLSDLVGFVYSSMSPETAARDLHQRIRAACNASDGPALIPVILDGENAWEYYPGNGREFLKAFYRTVAEDPELKAVTASEALEIVEQGSINHIVPGSWINANFDVWIGAEEDNRAWDLLNKARVFFEESKTRNGLDPGRVERAQHEMWIAEGSDWCWWYGPEHSTDLDLEFDLLYRKHLSNIYRLLGSSPPDELAVPIKQKKVRVLNYPPSEIIKPCIDGVQTTYFEWIGAGIYMPDLKSGSMHGRCNAIEMLYYGRSDCAFFLRLDLKSKFSQDHPAFEVRVNVNCLTPLAKEEGTCKARSGEDTLARFHALVRDGAIRQMEFWRRDEPVLVPLATGDKLLAAFENIFEVGIDYELLGISAGQRTGLQVSLWSNDLPLQVVPEEGLLNLELVSEFETWW